MFRWLKPYMPRGLYTRAALILLLPVVTLQLLVSIVFIQRHFEGVTELMTHAVLLEIRYLTDVVDNAPDTNDAQAAVDTIARPLELEVTLPAADQPQGDKVPWFDLSGRTVISTLRKGLPELGAVDLSDRREVVVWLGTPRGTMRLQFSRTRVSASNPHQLLVIMVVMGAFLTLVAFQFLRMQLRPITRLAAAAAEYGKGRIVPYHPSGAAEVRGAGAAFLDMRARIERQSQARTMMLSGVSHDLRTPLTRLRLGLSLLDEAEAAPLIRDVEDMQRLVDGFLDFAKGDAADAPEEVVPADLLRQVVADAQRAGQAVRLAPDFPTGESAAQSAQLRPVALRRALDNLVGNALRYGTCAEVGLAFSDRTLRVTVEDDGPGIPADSRDEAVRPFTRLDPARNQDRGPGVGLGLAIVSDVARLHGGVLRLGDSARLGGLRAELVLAR
ncbi:MAG: two-component sensor histidine kinase [Limimaricola sp.]|uniref:ATP-binding protein n=1 Tax=Limimaricola sp. TaxID=2211665 RepID=UPI001D2C9FBF|nr:ATP-binding protein [Limimaricola sp.]MBI1418192.1 two-component sensor histidine kinase [Limimaricola sp.]